MLRICYQLDKADDINSLSKLYSADPSRANYPGYLGRAK